MPAHQRLKLRLQRNEELEDTEQLEITQTSFWSLISGEDLCSSLL